MNIHKIIEVVENNSKIYELLKFCPYDILKRWSIKQYPKECIILNQGEIYEYFYIIIQGNIDIYIMAENGRKYSQAIYTAGNFIGELEIFDKRPFSCFVESITDVKLLEIKREYFLQWIELDKNINGHILRSLSSQFYGLSKKAGQDALYSLKQRLCYYLINSVNSLPGDNWKIDMQKDKLSGQLAVTQRSINRILKYLKEKDIIDVKNNYIIIKNLSALKEEENISRYE